jgi:hypothetical protein
MQFTSDGYAGTNAAFKFLTAGASSGYTEALTINGDGKVGIGTTSPVSPLYIKTTTSGNSRNHAVLTVKGDIGGNDISGSQHRVQFRIENSQGNYSNRALGLGVLDNGTGTIQASAGSEGYFPLMLNPISGNVGIGKTTAGHLLDVDGNVDALGYGSPGGGTFYMNHNSVRTVYTISNGEAGLLYCYGSWNAYGLAYFQWKSNQTTASCNVLVNSNFAAFQTDGNTNIWLKQTTGNAQHSYVKIIKFRPH